MPLAKPEPMAHPVVPEPSAAVVSVMRINIPSTTRSAPSSWVGSARRSLSMEQQFREHHRRVATRQRVTLYGGVEDEPDPPRKLPPALSGLAACIYCAGDGARERLRRNDFQLATLPPGNAKVTTAVARIASTFARFAWIASPVPRRCHLCYAFAASRC